MFLCLGSWLQCFGVWVQDYNVSGFTFTVTVFFLGLAFRVPISFGQGFRDTMFLVWV